MTITPYLKLFFGSQVWNNAHILVSLSGGSLISVRFVSRMIPRNDSYVEVCPNANGTPKSTYRCLGNWSLLHDDPIVR